MSGKDGRVPDENNHLVPVKTSHVDFRRSFAVIAIYVVEMLIKLSKILQLWLILALRLDNLYVSVVCLLFGLGEVGRVDAQESSTNPVILALHLNQSQTAMHLDLNLSETVPMHAFLVENPKRLIVDLPDMNFKAKTPHFNGRDGLITAFRYGLFADQQFRIVMDLSAPVKIISARVGPYLIGDKSARLMIDVATTDEATFHASVESESNRMSQQSSVPHVGMRTTLVPNDSVQARSDAKIVEDRRPVIMLDPGHGGPDSGAMGEDGVEEKNIVFSFANVLKTRLEAPGRYRVIMTRTQDIFVPLEERTRMARASAANLFLSIHADTLSDTGNVSGATIYTVSDKASDAEAARVAAHENQADMAAGLSVTEQPAEVADILFDLTRHETRAYAHGFSQSLIAAWKSGPFLALNKNPQRSAGFVVLKAPDVPSVLLELGYLSSPKDVKDLISPDWRDKATGSVVRAIDTFFAGARTH